MRTSTISVADLAELNRKCQNKLVSVCFKGHTKTKELVFEGKDRHDYYRFMGKPDREGLPIPSFRCESEHIGFDREGNVILDRSHVTVGVYKPGPDQERAELYEQKIQVLKNNGLI